MINFITGTAQGDQELGLLLLAIFMLALIFTAIIEKTMEWLKKW